MCGSFGLGEVGFERCHAGWRDGIRPRLRRIGGRAAAGARPAAIGRVVRRCRGSRRVAGACRCRAGCRKPLRCGGDGSSGTRTRRGGGADGRGAGHGRFRAPGASGSRTHDGSTSAREGRALRQRPWAGGRGRAGRNTLSSPRPSPARPAPGSRQRRHEGGARRNPRSAPAGCGMARPRAIARPRRQCASCLVGCDLARPWPGLLRCGTGGGPHRSRRVLKQATIRIDHGAAPLVQPEPGTLVTAEPEPGLELQGGDTIRVPGRDVNGHEPDLQGQGAAVHDRACGHRGLLPAGRTFPARPAPFQFPAPVMAAGGAHEAVGPASGGERPGTGGFIGKARLEGGAGHRAVIFPAARHIGTLYKHDAGVNQKLNISSNRTQRDTCLSVTLRT